MVVDPFTAAAAGVVVGGYFLVRGLVRLFRRKTVDVPRPTGAARSEIPIPPPVALKEVAVSPAAIDVQRPVTVALKVASSVLETVVEVASSVVETAVALSRGVTKCAKFVRHRLRAAVACSKAFLRAVFSPASPRVILASQHIELLVVSLEVLGLLKPFLKSHPRNRDTIVPAIAA
jgi:hypothetical protein